jgi:hypothetical protein
MWEFIFAVIGIALFISLCVFVIALTIACIVAGIIIGIIPGIITTIRNYVSSVLYEVMNPFVKWILIVVLAACILLPLTIIGLGIAGVL